MIHWIAIFIPIVATLLLLVFFRKQVVLWEIGLLLIPSALLILVLNFMMVQSLESATEYWGGYTTKVIYYQPWDEEVSCRHPIYCTRTYSCGDSKSPRTCTESYICGYEHPYDVDYHAEHWTKADNYGSEYEIESPEFYELQRRFATKPYLVDLHRHYHSINGNSFYTDWNKIPATSDVLTYQHTYKNKVRASHSVFKFDDIDQKQKKQWGLYDYPKMSGMSQQCVLGMPIDPITKRKLQYINGMYGVISQFRMYIMIFKNQSVEAAFKQRSYWEGGNKNEFVVCIGTDKSGKYQWCKAFSWMDKPDLEVRVQSFFNDSSKIDLNRFADWMPKQIEQHWKRKQFKDFEYLNVEITSGQLFWLITIVIVYNIGISIWIVKNKFSN
jgi:hypothetical protein